MLSLNTAYLSSNAIDSVPVPSPTRVYEPVPHRQLMHMVMSAFAGGGFAIDKPMHQIHKKKPRFASTFTISGGGLPNDRSLDWSVGIINTYDQYRAIHILFGGTVFICSNGLIVADHKLTTRHTTNVWRRLPDLIGRAVDAFGETIVEANRRHDRMRETRINDRRAIDAFALEVCRRNLLPITKAVEYADEIHKPSFNYEVPEDSLWNVHNAYTHMAKGMEAGAFSRRMIAFDKLLDQTFATV
jgi:hypothetical protein